jgi:MSHA biogenesis protein MshM
VYYDYFGLNQPPFRITPDTSLFFPGGNRGAILDAMIYAITSGEGIVKVVGEVGSGKTMLCRMLTVELPDNVEVVYLANPKLSPDDILHAIAFELKLDMTAGDKRLLVMNKLQDYLLQRHAENRQVVVFVEEAQSMPITTLEEIRLLSNLETHQHKLLQIVLFGQPELDQRISNKEIRQLKERITYSFNLNPLQREEIRDYLNSRLRACGYRANDVFDKAAVRTINRYSRGLLRRINILADKAMLAAFAANTHKVTARHVHIAARDSEFIGAMQRHRFAAVIVAGLLIILILAGWFVPFNKFWDKYKLALPAADTATEDIAAAPTGPATIPAEEVFVTHYQPQDDSRYYEYMSPGDPALEHYVVEYKDKNILLRNVDAETIPVTSGPSVVLEEDNQESMTNAVNALPVEEYYAQAIADGEVSMTREDTDLLIRQLKLLPPETGGVYSVDGACRLCTTVIYRPLIRAENL